LTHDGVLAGWDEGGKGKVGLWLEQFGIEPEGAAEALFEFGEGGQPGRVFTGREAAEDWLRGVRTGEAG
jgi:hypothetical protein